MRWLEALIADAADELRDGWRTHPAGAAVATLALALSMVCLVLTLAAAVSLLRP